MPTTTSRGFPVPLADGSDVPNVHTDIRNLGIYADEMFITVANSGSLPAAGRLGRRALATADNTIWLDIATGWLQEGIPLVTSLPGTPKEGQVVDLQTAAMATDNVVWRFRRVGSNWVFIGGGAWALSASSAINITAAANVKQDITDPNLTMPYGGTYEVETDATIQAAASGTADAFHVLYIKSNTTYTPVHQETMSIATGYHSLGGVRRVQLSGAGQIIRLAIDRPSASSTAILQGRNISIKPVQVA